MYTGCFTFEFWVNSALYFILNTQSVAIGHRSLYGRNNVKPLIYNCVLAGTNVLAGHWDVESDSQNIPRELISSRGTVIPAAHGNTDDPTFFLKLSNIYEKWELCISAKFEQNSENTESANQIYKVCICYYA